MKNRLLHTQEWEGERYGIRRSLAVHQVEGERRTMVVTVVDKGVGHGIELTPRQALELSQHLLAFAIRCAQ